MACPQSPHCARGHRSRQWSLWRDLVLWHHIGPTCRSWAVLTSQVENNAAWGGGHCQLWMRNTSHSLTTCLWTRTSSEHRIGETLWAQVTLQPFVQWLAL